MPNADAAAPKEERSVYAIVLALVVISVLLGIAYLPRILPAGSTAAMAGVDAPEVKAEVVANGTGTFVLTAQRGKPVLMDFWASWCGPCRAEAPVISRAAERYKDRAIVVGVNTSDEPGKAASFARALGVDFPVVYDERERIAHAYHVSNLPTLVLVSKDGKVLATRTGLTGDAEVDELMKQALGAP